MLLQLLVAVQKKQPLLLLQLLRCCQRCCLARMCTQGWDGLHCLLCPVLLLHGPA